MVDCSYAKSIQSLPAYQIDRHPPLRLYGLCLSTRLADITLTLPHSLSSMTNTLVLNHLPNAFLFFLIMLHNTGVSCIPKPIPPNECNVTPPILHAAIPVDAVTWMASSNRAYFFLRDEMISRRSTDLPVPARPRVNSFSAVSKLQFSSATHRHYQ